MDDRELIELAAKAIGKTIRYNYLGCQDANYAWYPLDDDGDAFRLAAHLELDVMHRVVGGRRIEVLAAGGPLIKYEYEEDTVDAMRRAIVLAAAQIGAKK